MPPSDRWPGRILPQDRRGQHRPKGGGQDVADGPGIHAVRSRRQSPSTTSHSADAHLPTAYSGVSGVMEVGNPIVPLHSRHPAGVGPGNEGLLARDFELRLERVGPVGDSGTSASSGLPGAGGRLFTRNTETDRVPRRTLGRRRPSVCLETTCSRRPPDSETFRSTGSESFTSTVRSPVVVCQTATVYHRRLPPLRPHSRPKRPPTSTLSVLRTRGSSNLSTTVGSPLRRPSIVSGRLRQPGRVQNLVEESSSSSSLRCSNGASDGIREPVRYQLDGLTHPGSCSLERSWLASGPTRPSRNA